MNFLMLMWWSHNFVLIFRWKINILGMPRGKELTFCQRKLMHRHSLARSPMLNFLNPI